MGVCTLRFFQAPVAILTWANTLFFSTNFLILLKIFFCISLFLAFGPGGLQHKPFQESTWSSPAWSISQCHQNLDLVNLCTRLPSKSSSSSSSQQQPAAAAASSSQQQQPAAAAAASSSSSSSQQQQQPAAASNSNSSFSFLFSSTGASCCSPVFAGSVEHFPSFC